MHTFETGINLYGMMKCGKSTVGGLIAAQYDLPFIDTDDLIEKEYGMKPGEIVKAEGPNKFMAVQREIILAHNRSAAEVWATGGSVTDDNELVRHLGA
jgi:shikimate kinase